MLIGEEGGNGEREWEWGSLTTFTTPKSGGLRKKGRMKQIF